MSKIRQRYDDEFRKNAVKLSYATTCVLQDKSEPRLSRKSEPLIAT
jgi:hypothetical protein